MALMVAQGINSTLHAIFNIQCVTRCDEALNLDFTLFISECIDHNLKKFQYWSKLSHFAGFLSQMLVWAVFGTSNASYLRYMRRVVMGVYCIFPVYLMDVIFLFSIFP